MEHKKSQSNNAERWRSSWRGHLILSLPLPFLFCCTGYLTSTLMTIGRLILASLLMLYVYIMYTRADKIIHDMKQRGVSHKRAFKNWMVGIALVLLAIALYGTWVVPIIPLYLKGIFASSYYVCVMLFWYQKIKEPKE